MRIHRFYIKSVIGDTENYVLQDEMLQHQLLHVFRYKVGQGVLLFDNSGFEYKAVIDEINKKNISFTISERKPGLVQRETLGKELVLCFSLIKKDNIEFILQKGTELGVTEFYPLLSERSEKKEFNEERGQKIIIEATEQCGWAKIPKLHPISDLESVIENTKQSYRIVCSTLTSSEKNADIQADNIALFVGPEGGWTENELELFKKNNIETCSLGKQVLRAETAAIAAVVKLL